VASAPASLGALLQGFLKPPAYLRPSNIDDATWRRVVGPGVVRCAMPLRLRDEVLLVRVSSSAWAQQLSMMRELLCERLTEAGYKVRDLRFNVGPVHPPRRLLGSSIFVPYLRPLPLPPPLEDALLQVQDVSLRLAIARAASANLAWQRSVTVDPPLRSPLPGLVSPLREPPRRKE
jgi:hypothetical protein